ncbi:Hypothetical_protein [Hexamita inflata]|uniref:Hypothetical_protein n=1 Tax=Hexamita inflata TaxID=28002 RepID=A0AA86UBF4_9EUKA|nr:Hypothetical protein HINF_LOCUS36629 [Hexamita inflata]
MMNLFHCIIATCPTQISDQQLSVDASTKYIFSSCFPNNLINKSFVASGSRTSQLFEVLQRNLLKLQPSAEIHRPTRFYSPHHRQLYSMDPWHGSNRFIQQRKGSNQNLQ